MSGWLNQLWYGTGRPTWSQRAIAAPLGALSTAFRATVALRRRAFELGLLSRTRVAGAFVVSVGNVNVGGVGKTPVVVFLAQWAQRCGRRVAVLSRGHGRLDRASRDFDASALPPWSEVGDEPRLIAQKLPGVRVFVGRSRLALAQAARDRGYDFLVLDDGMQHQRLERDVELVVVDGARGFGNGKLLPSGPLREAPSSLERAHVVWLKEGERALELSLPEKPLVRARHAASAVVDPSGALWPLSELRGARVIALSGIGDPDALSTSLRALGAQVLEVQAFADHHPFTAQEISAALARARSTQARVVTTEKDAARLPEGLPLWKLQLGVRVSSGLELLAGLLGLEASAAGEPPDLGGGRP